MGAVAWKAIMGICGLSKFGMRPEAGSNKIPIYHTVKARKPRPPERLLTEKDRLKGHQKHGFSGHVCFGAAAWYF